MKSSIVDMRFSRNRDDLEMWISMANKCERDVRAADHRRGWW